MKIIEMVVSVMTLLVYWVWEAHPLKGQPSSFPAHKKKMLSLFLPMRSIFSAMRYGKDVKGSRKKNSWEKMMFLTFFSHPHCWYTHTGTEEIRREKKGQETCASYRFCRFNFFFEKCYCWGVGTDLTKLCQAKQSPQHYRKGFYVFVMRKFFSLI